MRSAPRGQHLSGEDLSFVRALVDRHRDAVAKIGSGIVSVSVDDSGNYGSVCFWVHRADGSRVDVSYTECLSPSKPHIDVLAALRWEVDAQQQAVRMASDQQICEHCSTIIVRSIHPVEVDHAPPMTFAMLAEKFLAATKAAGHSITVEEDGATRLRLVDRHLAQVWQEYHRLCSRLRPLHRTCHVEVTRGRA